LERAEKRGARERFVSGKGGSRRMGIALGDGEGAWMKWTRSGDDGAEGSVAEKRYCGREAFRSASLVRHEYSSSLGEGG
jgi:hypothetical protein